MQSGTKIYTTPVLFCYDFFVLQFSNLFAWRCPSRVILDLYNQNISTNHLDIGVGTGYFLDKCTYPESPKITLLDLNPNALRYCASRISRYEPNICEADILDVLPSALPHFDSIGMNYLLHCLPGSFLDKEIVFTHAKSLLRENGVVFGATILGDSANLNFLSRCLSKIYNNSGVFCNSKDVLQDLELILSRNFKEYRLWQQGCVALFSARI